MSAPVRGVASVKRKLEQAWSIGDHYAALQHYQTLARRLAAHGEGAQVDELLVDGVRRMVEAGKEREGSELSGVFISLLPSLNRPWKGSLQSVIAVLELMAPLEDLYAAIESKLLSYAKSVATDDELRSLHDTLGYIHMKNYRPADASAHFAQGTGGSEVAEEHAKALLAWSVESSELDLFIARAMLYCVAARNIKGALELEKALKTMGKLPETPLIRGVGYIVRVCQSEASALFSQIRNAYGPSFGRDPAFTKLLDTISQRYFNTQPARPGGLMGLMQSMLGGQS